MAGAAKAARQPSGVTLLERASVDAGQDVAGLGRDDLSHAQRSPENAVIDATFSESSDSVT